MGLDWFRSYLSNKKQHVSVNGKGSEQKSITHGVPQGSINHLPSASKVLSFHLFADDTNIYFKSSDIVHLQKVMNRELRKVRKWLDANHLALNIDKTNFVIFHSSQKKIVHPVVLRIGKKIHDENCVKFLGVLLDSSLSWKHHIAELSKKLARIAGIFYKVRHIIPLETLKMLYGTTHCFTLVSYGITVWGLTHKSYLDLIIIAQKKITFY